MTALPADFPAEWPADVTVVTPTRRLAHHLRARHDAACLTRGLATWRTPDVVTWSELLRRHFEHDRATGVAQSRWLEAGHARLAWEHVLRRDEGVGHLLAPTGLAARAQRSWTLMHEYGIPRASLADDPSPEVQAFARWVEGFERWLRKGGWLDPAEAAWTVGPGEPGRVVRLVGFDRLTPAQTAALDRLTGLGADVALHAAEPTGLGTGPGLAVRRDFDDEIETAARWAAARLEREPGITLAIIVPGLAQQRARVRKVLDRVLVPAAAWTGGPAPESTAYELAAARPLSDRPVVATALAWLEATRPGVALDALSALLRSPFDAAADAEATGRAEIDARLRRFEPHLRGLPRLADLVAQHGACPLTAAQLAKVVARSRTWTAARLPSRWVPEFLGVLQDVGWPGVAPGSEEHQAAQRWRTLLADFAGSDDVTGPMRAAVALGQLRTLAADTAFEPQEVAAPLLVIDPETAAGMRFDGLWVTGLDSMRWPPPAAPDPFLPRDAQVRQGVPGANAEVAEADARRLLDRLCGAAPEVVCSVPQFEEEAPVLASAWAARWRGIDALDLWSGGRAAETSFETRPTLEQLVDGALPAFREHEVAKGGTRLLELQASCPFRAAVELRLGARALESPETGIAATERGDLVHKVLQRAWETLRTQARLAAMPEAERRDWVTALVHEHLDLLRADADPVRLRLLDLEQRWMVERVLELLADDLARPPFEVVHTEAPFDVEVGGVQVHLKIDRVDRLEDGTLAVIDYKTGTSARPAAWMGERPELPQLPLYVRAVGQDAVGAIAFGVVRKGGTGYLGYAREKALFPELVPFEGGKRAFKEYDSWDELLQAWRRRLDAIALEHAGGDARLAPDPRKACRYCHLPGLCRSAQASLDDEEGADGRE